MAGLSEDQYGQLFDALEAAKGSGDSARAQEIESLLRDAGPPGGGMSVAESAAHGVGQGATMGFSDELYGGVRATFGEGKFSDDYEKYRDQYREELRQSREQNPWATGIGEVGGGIVAGALTGGAGAVSGAAKASLGRLAAIGAATGGVAGAGYSEGESVGDVATDAGVGATFGGVMGGAVGGITKGVTNLANKITPRSAMNRLFDELVERTGMSHDAINDMMVKHPDMILADVSDEFRLLLNEVGGPEQLAALERRTRGTRENVLISLAKSFKQSGRTPVFKQLKTEAENIAALADDHYQKAYRTTLSNGARQRIAEELQGDNYKKAVKHAAKLWDAEHPGADLPDSFDVQWLDYLQRGFRDLSDKAKKTPQLQAAIGKQRTRLLELIDGEVDDFKVARELWRGKHADAEAAELGKSILSMKNLNDREIVDKMVDFLPSEKAYFKLGVQEAFDDKLSNVSNISDMTQFIRERDGVQKVLKMAMGPERFKVFMERMSIEGEKFRTFRVGKESLRTMPDGQSRTVAEDAKRIVFTLLADAGLNTSGGIATHAAYRSAMRNAVARMSGHNIQNRAAQRLLSNRPLVPGAQPSPLAFRELSGAAGTVPPWALSYADE